MLFAIQRVDGLYFHNKGRIILFQSDKEARNFLNMFVQYSTNRLASEGRIDELMRVSMSVVSECRITPVEFDVDNIECGTVYAEELLKVK